MLRREQVAEMTSLLRSVQRIRLARDLMVQKTRVCLPRQQGTRRGWFEGSRWMSFCVPAVRGV